MDIYATIFHNFVTIPCQKLQQKAQTQGPLQLTFFLIKMLITKFGNHEGKDVVLTK
jgi:membrane protein YdbS with pleckstrin-like domain